MILDTIFEGGLLAQPGRPHRRRRGRAAGGGAGAVLPVHLYRPRVARVADDHQAAQSIGIPLNRIWVMVWSVAGLVALVAGIDLGLQVRRAVHAVRPAALRALPVVILGGLTSVPGAILGGLIIGVGEKLSEVYLGPWWAAASRSGSPTCWPWCSCCSVRKDCSARRSSTGSEAPRKEPCSTARTASSRPATGPTSRSSRSAQDRVCRSAAAGGGLRRRAVAGQRLPAARHPDPLPDPVAGGRRA